MEKQAENEEYILAFDTTTAAYQHMYLTNVLTAISRHRIFYKMRVEIEGSKFKLYVRKAEYEALKKVIGKISELELGDYYKRHLDSDLSRLPIFEE